MGFAGFTPEQAAVLGRMRRTREVVGEVALERGRQDKKWGEASSRGLPNGGCVGLFKGDLALIAAESREKLAKKRVKVLSGVGQVTWADILEEEFCEALSATTPEDLRGELVQVAAVAVAWIEALDA